MTSSSDPDPILPLAEQSTLEEDYFADLLLDDDPDELVIPTGREMRMNRAFADSKRIYRKRDALTEPGVSRMLSLDISRIHSDDVIIAQWYAGLKNDPRIRQDPDSSILQAFDAKMAG